MRVAHADQHAARVGDAVAIGGVDQELRDARLDAAREQALDAALGLDPRSTISASMRCENAGLSASKACTERSGTRTASTGSVALAVPR